MINYIYNHIYYKNVGILLGGCLTEKNYWGLLTGDDGVGLVAIRMAA